MGKIISEKFESLKITTINLPKLFREVKNPPVLKVLVIPDTHAKFRDDKAFSCMLEYAYFYNPHVVLILGDFVDAEGLSHWPSKSMEPRRIVPEMLEARQLLSAINVATKKAKRRFYLEGNHEDWINQYLTSHAEMFDELEKLNIDVNLSSMLDLKKYGYELFEINSILKIGKANFTHGYYTPDNHPKTHLMKLKDNIFYGHTHDTKSWVESSLYGTIEAQSFGCLCRLDAKFLRGKPNNWGHGFGEFNFFINGNYSYLMHKIKDGKMSAFGKVFSS